MVTKKHVLLFSILIQCSMLIFAQQTKKSGLKVSIDPSANPFTPSPTSSGSAGSAAAQPSMGDAGVAIGIGLQSIAGAMKQKPEGTTFPQSLEAFAGALKATTEGDPKEGGMRHFAGGLIALSGALKAMTEGKPEDSGMRYFAGALSQTAHGIQNFGINKETLEDIKKLTEDLHKTIHRHAIKCIALCGGTASACSIPVYGVSCSNVCCLTAALIALRPDTAGGLATQYLSTEIGARVTRLLDICCENERIPQQIVDMSLKKVSKPGTPIMIRPAQPVAVVPPDMDSKHLTTPVSPSIKSRPVDEGDTKEEPKKDK